MSMKAGMKAEKDSRRDMWRARGIHIMSEAQAEEFEETSFRNLVHWHKANLLKLLEGRLHSFSDREKCSLVRHGVLRNLHNRKGASYAVTERAKKCLEVEE